MRARISAPIAVLVFALLSPFQIPAARAAVSAGVGVAQSNLLMYFDAGNYSGFSAPTLTDLSGNGNNATTATAGTGSTPTFNTANGKYLNFTGNGNANGGYLSIPTFSSGPSDWSGVSVSMYVNIGATYSNVERVFDFGNGSPSDNFWVGTGDTGQMAMEVFNGTASSGWCRSANNAAVVNEWAHWTFIFDGTTCKVYKNNVLSNSVSYTYRPKANINFTRNYLGKSNWAADPYFEGSIADLAIYKSALTDSERTQNFNAQSDISAPSVSGNLLSSPENQLSVSTLNLETGATYTKLAGLDATKLDISSNGVVAFLSNPNYEARDSANSTFQYQINVRAIDTAGNFVEFVLQVTVTDVVENASLSPPSLSATPYKGIAVTITVTPTGDGTSIPGKVTYLIAGKRIPGCYKKIYTGTGNSTCTFDPALRGSQEISVTFTPTNTNFTAATSKKSFFIYKRSTTR